MTTPPTPPGRRPRIGGPRPDGVAGPAEELTAFRESIEPPPTRRSAWQERGTAWLERAAARSTLVDLVLRLRERDREAAGSVAGSAVAFRLFLFVVPLLLLAVALAGFLAGHVEAGDVSGSAGVTGVVAAQVDAALSQPTTTRWTALVAGILGTLSAGRSLAKGLVVATALSWRVTTDHKATVRITATVMGIIIGLAFMAAIVNRIRRAAGVAVVGVSLIGASGVYLLAWLILSLTLPRSTSDPGALLPGAALMAVAITGLQAVTQLVLPDRISDASALYGGLGVTVATLGWFFIVGRLAVFSMTVNAVVNERLGSVSTIVFGLPGLRRLPAHSPRLARFFGLDDPDT